MEEKIKLVIVLAQESKHIVSSCWGEQRCRRKSCGNWRNGKEHAAHLEHHQYYTDHRWGNYIDSMSLSQNVGCECEV
jgi:hypothetical protein